MKLSRRTLFTAGVALVVAAGAVTIALVSGPKGSLPPDVAEAFDDFSAGACSEPGFVVTIRSEAAPGSLSLMVRDGVDGRGMPVRVSIYGMGETPSPVFSEDIGVGTLLTGGGLAAARFVATRPDVAAEVQIIPGRYRLEVGRGPEWERVYCDVDISLSGVAVEGMLPRAWLAPGWVASDLHVHAAPSYDSDTPVDQRIYSIVIEGIDVIAATDHDVVVRYGEDLRALGFDKDLLAINGSEVTVGDAHFGVFPLGWRPGEKGMGSPPVKKLGYAEALATIRRHAPLAVIQANHPRHKKKGYFEHIDLKPDGSFAPGGSLDFDLMEIANGVHPTMDFTLRTLQDWFFLLQAGHRIIATGNSDSHGLQPHRLGYPRTMIWLDGAPAVDLGAVMRGLRSGRVLVTTGPFLDASVGGVPMGGFAPLPASGWADLTLRLATASWVRVDELRVWVGGDEVLVQVLPPANGPRDETFVIPVPVTGPTWIVAMVSGVEPLSMDSDKATVRPYAITNPVYVGAPESL